MCLQGSERDPELVGAEESEWRSLDWICYHLGNSDCVPFVFVLGDRVPFV